MGSDLTHVTAPVVPGQAWDRFLDINYRVDRRLIALTRARMAIRSRDVEAAEFELARLSAWDPDTCRGCRLHSNWREADISRLFSECDFYSYGNCS